MELSGPFVASLETLACRRSGKRLRISSYDRAGGNDDRIYLTPGETRTFGDIVGAGCVTHIWCTFMNEGFVLEKYSLRKVVLRMFWDDEPVPSVEAPIGTFSGWGTRSAATSSPLPCR